jgi:hypothetical protein
MDPVQITQHKKDLIILDIDGCLVDSDGRLPKLIHDKDRAAYDAAHHTDFTIPAGHLIYMLLQNLHAVDTGRCVLYVTGRRECAREYTLAQLNHVLGKEKPVESWQLLMRPLDAAFDMHDTVLKPQVIEAAGYSLDRILLVIEDRNSTVAMWRERGITCYQSQIGDF